MLPLEIEQRKELIRREIEKTGAELLDIGFRRSGSRGILTVIVDKSGGISLDECARISHVLSALFDEFEKGSSEGGAGPDSFIRGAYYLEVNSPGLDRPLVGQRDFERAKEVVVRIHWKNESGVGLMTVGKILSCENGVIQLKSAQNGQAIGVPLNSVTKAVREIMFKR